MYGIYNTLSKKFQFGICEDSKKKAINKLVEKIGKDAYKWRFVARKIKDEASFSKGKVFKCECFDCGSIEYVKFGMEGRGCNECGGRLIPQK